MGPRGRFYPYLYILHILDCLGQDMQVLYLGRAPRTKETLPDFLKWRRVTRPPLVFCGLTGSQRTPGFWGVTAWYQSLGIRVPRELGFGYPSPLSGLMWSIGIWKLMDIKFGLRPWWRKSITTRCGSMLSLGMRLPRKGTTIRKKTYLNGY